MKELIKARIFVVFTSLMESHTILQTIICQKPRIYHRTSWSADQILDFQVQSGKSWHKSCFEPNIELVFVNTDSPISLQPLSKLNASFAIVHCKSSVRLINNQLTVALDYIDYYLFYFIISYVM